MPNAEEYECPTEDCEDSGGTPPVEPTPPETYCPFKDKLQVKEDGTVILTECDVPYPDGTYNNITIEGGCVVGLTLVPPPGYTPPACCGEGGDPPPPSGLPLLNGDACNLTTYVGDTLLTKGYFDNSADYTVTGCGTTGDPWRVNGPTVPDGSITAQACSASNAVSVTGIGTSGDPLIICHKDGALAAGDYDGITVDQYGHVIAVDLTQSIAKNYVSNSNTITFTDLGANVYSVDQEIIGAAGGATLFGVTLSVDQYGRGTVSGTPVAGITQTISFTKPDATIGTLTFTDGLLTGTT